MQQQQNVNFKLEVPRWGIQEISFPVSETANPYKDLQFFGLFKHKNEEKRIQGFYAGNGIYKIRFMPSFEGEYSFEVLDNKDKAVSLSNYFEALPAIDHGPVRLAHTYHFAYDDGTPYYPVGTTCYVWNLQDDDSVEDTLFSLKESGFNKIRFCLFPKHYDYNLNEPHDYPFEGSPMDSSILNSENFMEFIPEGPGNEFNKERFNPAYFERLDGLIDKLHELDIQADIILFHPYDRWGFSTMSEEEDAFWLDYIISRYAAYPNVWWSLANEYDLLDKSMERWEKLGNLIANNDPYSHLRSIHNCRPFYDHTRPWITHASLQRQDLYRTTEFTDEFRQRWKKPIVWDEIGYEGNLQHGWGSLTPEELVRRSWEAAIRGGYPGHGETLLSEDPRLWWSHGGKLKGESWKRLDFLRSILEEVPGHGLAPYEKQNWDESAAIPETEFAKPIKSQYLFYFGFQRPSFRDFYIDDQTPFKAEVIDTWNMSVQDAGIHKGKFRIPLGSNPYMLVRLTKVC